MSTVAMASFPCCARIAGAISEITWCAAASSLSGPTLRSMPNGENPMALYLPTARNALAALALVSGTKNGFPFRGNLWGALVKVLKRGARRRYPPAGRAAPPDVVHLVQRAAA